MVTKRKRRKSTFSKKRFIGKPNGQIQERVQVVGPILHHVQHSALLVRDFAGQSVPNQGDVFLDDGQRRAQRSGLGKGIKIVEAVYLREGFHSTH